MLFVWAGDREEVNQQRNFKIQLEREACTLVVCAVDNYQIFCDGKFVCYGPERTAGGYSRKKIVKLNSVSELEIKVISHGKNMFMCDRQLPFFGAEITDAKGNVLYKTTDFSCYTDLSRDTNTEWFSVQRGFIEKYSFDTLRVRNEELYLVSAPIILEGVGDTCKYNVANFSKIYQGKAREFDVIEKPWWQDKCEQNILKDAYRVDKVLLPNLNDYEEICFELEADFTGFLELQINAKTSCEIILCMEEVLPDGKWILHRSQCNDYIVITAKEGEWKFLANEPYTAKYLKVLYKGDVEISPNFILYQNDNANFISVSGDKKIVEIIEAAKRSFCQNSVDVFTDCPGRERAGWLCDSYFTSLAELLFTGENKIERNFLENYIIAEYNELPKGMLPMCFPSEHDSELYIPNWAMWFVIELYEYYKRSEDYELIVKAKEKVYGILDFFKKYLNEEGLLENLESWVFIEWSICNDKEYTKGVNFPSNMLYADMLAKTGELYKDESLIVQSKDIKEKILKMSYNGKFFVDNAVRVDGKITRCEDHISETCQYYALFFRIIEDENFANLIKEKFGPYRKEDEYPEIGRSNAFIGNYLRLFWLVEIGEVDRFLKESVEYFSYMVERTGTLWEMVTPNASCNHGFASVIAVLLLKALAGYKTVKNHTLILDENSASDILKVWQN